LAWLLLAGVVGLAGLGCEATPQGGPEKKPLKIKVSEPIVRDVTDYEIFSGRTEAVETADVRARVSGYLKDIKFADGAYVAKDAVLFEIDDRPYKATLAQAVADVATAKANVVTAQAAVAQNEANLDFLVSEYGRNMKLLNKGALSGSDYDKSRGDYSAMTAAVKSAEAVVQSAEAKVKSAEAAEETARLNFGFTRVLAPISGIVSRRAIDRGNMVTADQTILTNVVRLDEIYATFDVDERTWLNLRRRLIDAGQLDTLENATLNVQVALSTSEGYPFKGVIDFADNKLDPSTGTMRLRATIKNPDRYLQPGLFVRVLLPVGSSRSGLLLADQAIGSDQGRSFVLVVNDKNEVVYRQVEPGAMHYGLREVRPTTPPPPAPADPDAAPKDKDASRYQPLQKTDHIVVEGLQRVRAGDKVQPALVPMPQPAKPTVQSPAVVDRPANPEAKGAAAAR
jgi:multidrug efflux pump subunit AcrA (membrane-fusion protein)